MKVIVVGAGIVGCSIAFALAARKVRVVLLEKECIASGASGRAAGMLAPFSEATVPGPIYESGVAALRAFPIWLQQIEDHSREQLPICRGGGIVVAQREEQMRELKERLSWQRLLSPSSQCLDANELRTMVPHLGPGLVGGAYHPDEFQLDSRAYTLMVARAAVACGVELQEQQLVRSLLRHGERVIGVRLANLRELQCDAVVLATGTGNELDTRLPIEPVKGELIRLRPQRPVARFLIRAGARYVAPTFDGSVLVGATERLDDRDLSVRAGTVHSLLRIGSDLVPDLHQAAFEGAWAGLRPALPDRLPAIGHAPHVKGLWLALGHFRHGVMLGAWTAARIASALLDGASLPEPMLPSRFNRPDPELA